MRVAISGSNRDEIVSGLAKVMNVEPTKPVSQDLLGYGSDSFEHFNDENVLFDGSVLDSVELTKAMSEGMTLLAEQIVLCALQNYDKVFVAGTNDYASSIAEYMPDKIEIVNTIAEVKL